MTRDQYDKLVQYEQDLKSAVKLNFMSMPNGRFQAIMAIYNEVFNESLNPRQMNCSTCRLNALKRIGGEYLSFQQEIAKSESKERLNNEKNGKAGRPKSFDIDE